MISPNTAHITSGTAPASRPSFRKGTRKGTRKVSGRLTTALLALVALPALSGCVSEAQMRLAVAERDREIDTLRADKVELNERIDLLQYEKEDLRSQLANASSRMPTVNTNNAAYTPEDTALVAFPELAEMGITMNQRAGETVISVPAEVTFASGKATVSENGRGALLKVAARLKSEYDEGSKFYIEGHTDNDPIRKSKFASNRELSIQRAMAVLEFLVTEGRVADRRFVVVGHGQYDPIASNDAKNKAKNRRVEIVVKRAK